MMLSAFRAISSTTIRALSHHTHCPPLVWKHEELSNRGIIETRGKDAIDLLQGLTTNDMNCLVPKSCPVIYSMLLNIKGRVLYDILIYLKTAKDATEPSYLIECDRSVIPDIIKHLKMYKMRKKVQLNDVSSEIKVFGILPEDSCPEDGCRPEVLPDESSKIISLTADPRVVKWSARLLLPSDVSATSVIQDTTPASAGSYTALRYALGIGEGVDDFPVGSSLPLEANGALLNGVSFNKGCYLGQELTARSHHTGIIRKRLMPLQLEEGDGTTLPQNSEVVDRDSGATVGRSRTFVGGRGLALLRLSALSSKSVAVRCEASGKLLAAQTWVPDWWPDDVVVKI